jgi:hypothetical protein
MMVGIGPTNAGGQAFRLAKALRRHGIDAESYGLENQHAEPLKFQVDRIIRTAEWGGVAWRTYLRRFTHLLLWNGLSPAGRGRWWNHESGPSAVVFRGSELRNPKHHARLEAWSPFKHGDELTDALQLRNDRLRDRLRHHPPDLAYVATLEMRDYLPRARWLPIIADPVEGRPVLARKRSTVLHMPTNGQLKGSHHVDSLEAEGFTLQRPSLLRPEKALAAIAEADIVIGGLVLGDYGGTEIQAMAAGRVVVGNVSERVRRRMPVEVPIVQATPDTLPVVLADILADRPRYRELAEAGRGFAERFHDGRYSVGQLADFLPVGSVAA